MSETDLIAAREFGNAAYEARQAWARETDEEAKPQIADAELRWARDVVAGLDSFGAGLTEHDRWVYIASIISKAREEGRQEERARCAEIADNGARLGDEDGNPDVVAACRIVARKIRSAASAFPVGSPAHPESFAKPDDASD